MRIIVIYKDMQSKRHQRTELTSGRKFNADELQLMLLGILADEPAHGYELIKRLKELSQGYYSPSPGVLYPALAKLESHDFADVEAKGRRKKYHLTQAGEQHLQAQQARAQELFATLQHAAKKMLWFKYATSNPADAERMTGWQPEYVAARQTLQRALLSFNDSCPQEQQRVAKILHMTAKEILNKH